MKNVIYLKHVKSLLCLMNVLCLWGIWGVCLSVICLPGARGAEAEGKMSLAGTWEFALDKEDKGSAAGWENKSLPDQLKLPGITDEGTYGEAEHAMGILARKHKYVGAAWYSREVDIPSSWSGKSVELYLERVKWLSRLWVDGRLIGEDKSLHTPHVYNLGALSPGKHRITLLIDNREQVPLLGSSWGHSTGEQTQKQWNGVLGKIELRALSPSRLSKVRTFTDHEGALKVEGTYRNETGSVAKGNLYLSLTDKKTGSEVWSRDFPIVLSGVDKEVIVQNESVEGVKPWDEFDPQLYVFRAEFRPETGEPSSEEHAIGFRTLKTEGAFISLNGIPRYMRGNLDCADFPLTGYPPTDKESWLKILQHYVDHGLNHVRFHSWTPPQAAFEAADELGLYVLSEIFWRDGWMGTGLDLAAAESFLRPELMRIADEYGNHASLLMLAMGNELGGFDVKAMDPWIAEVKAHDPRHLYATSVRREATPHADIDFMGNLGAGYPSGYIYQGLLNTRRNFGANYGEANWYLKDRGIPYMPGIQHEVGQWVFYPDWAEIEKYTGLLDPEGLKEARRFAEENGVLEQNADFVQSSGKQAMVLYKEGIESMLRTPDCGGFQLLGMQDFTGQGIALIGWLDAFYDNKGVVTPEEVRAFCNTTVPLMEADKYVFVNTEPLTADIKIIRFDKAYLPNAQVEWSLVDPSKVAESNAGVVASGEFPAQTLKNGAITPVGTINYDTKALTQPVHLTLKVGVKGTSFANSWSFWVFPDAGGDAVAVPGDVLVTKDPTEAREALKVSGKKVILLAHELGRVSNASYAQWMPSFWVGNANQNDGQLVRADHPALDGFPTEAFMDFQWWDLCKNSRGFELKGLPNELRPIVQPINDFHFNKKLGSVVELSSPEGGKLLICGYDVASDLSKRPVAKAFFKSLVDYAGSSKFAPKISFTDKWFGDQLIDMNAPLKPPPKFKDAYLYIKPGGSPKLPIGTYYTWEEAQDGVTSYDANKYGYELKKFELIWKRYEDYSLWQGADMRLEFKLPFNFEGYIAVTFDSYNNEWRTGTILHNGQTVNIGKLPAATTPGDPSGTKTVYLKLKSGDTLLGKYGVDIQCTQGGNLLITEVALLPDIPEEDKPAPPEEFKGAQLYVRPGGNPELPLGSYTTWNQSLDLVYRKSSSGPFDYSVSCDLTWKRYENYSLWQGYTMTVDLSLPQGFGGIVYFVFDSYNDEARTGTITYNQKVVDIGKLPAPFPEGGGGYKTIACPVGADDIHEGKCTFVMQCTGGWNLLITDMAVMANAVELSPAAMNFPSFGGVMSLGIKANCPWTLNVEDDTWVRVEGSSTGLKEETRLVSVSSNPTATPREGRVLVSAQGLAPRVLTIHQDSSAVSYDDWARSHWGSDRSPGDGKSAPLDNPSGDTVSNLMKYALGLDPLVKISPSLGTLGLASDGSGSSYLTLAFDINPHAVGLRYIAEFSRDGGLSWGETREVTPSFGENTLLIRDSEEFGKYACRLIRLKVELTE